MGKHPQDDQEDDESWNPGPEFVRVNDFVAKEGDGHGANGNDYNTCITRDVIVNSVDQLGPDDDIR
jgi:hypothetical protein